MMLAVIWVLWLIVNLIAFALYGMDKRRARKNLWRIPERTLLLFTWLMGGVGALAGMKVFRHKTKHLVFQISAPVGAVLSVAVMAALSLALLGVI